MGHKDFIAFNSLSVFVDLCTFAFVTPRRENNAVSEYSLHCGMRIFGCATIILLMKILEFNGMHGRVFRNTRTI